MPIGKTERYGPGVMVWLMLWLPAPGFGYGLAAGQPTPHFDLSGLDDESYSLRELTANGPALLVFWSTHCDFCNALIPKFKRVHAAYHERGLTLAAINIGHEDDAEVRRYAKEHELDYLVLNDDESKTELARAYAVVGTPTVVLVSSDGEVRYYGHDLPDLSASIGAGIEPGATPR